MTVDYTPGTFSGSNISALAFAQELTKIQAALATALSKEQITGNGMEVNFDMNGQTIINAVTDPLNPTSLVTLQQLQDAVGSTVDIPALVAMVETNDLDIDQLQLAVAQNAEDIADGFTADRARLDALEAQGGSVTQQDLDDLETQLQAVDATTAAAISTEAGIRLGQVQALQTQLASETSSRQGVDASLSAQINVEEARNDTQDTAITAVQADIAAINAQLPDDDTALAAAIAANATAIADEINDTNTDVNAILATQAALQTSVNTNTAAAGTNASDIATLQGEQTVQDNQISSITADNVAQGSAISGLQTNVTALTGTVSTVQGVATTAAADATANAAAIATLSGTVGTIQSDVGDLQVKQVVFPFTYDPVADGTEVVHFTVAEAFLLTNAGASHATARTAPPSAAAQWNILRNGVVVGTADWLLGNTVGTITGYTAVAPVTYAVGDVFSVEATTNNGIEAVSLTLLFQEAP